MATYWWFVPPGSSGEFHNAANWSASVFSPVGGAGIPGPGDTAVFLGDFDSTQSFGGDCEVTAPVDVATIYLSSYGGIINFLGNSVTCTCYFLIQDGHFHMVTGVGGTWLIGKAIFNAQAYYGLYGQPLNLHQDTQWNIELTGVGSGCTKPGSMPDDSYYIDYSGLHISGGELRTWYSVDNGDNENIVFLPANVEEVALYGEVDGTGYLQGSFLLVEPQTDGIFSKPFIKGSGSLLGAISLQYPPTTTTISGDIGGAGGLESGFGVVIPVKGWPLTSSTGGPGTTGCFGQTPYAGQIGADCYPALIGGIRTGDVLDWTNQDKCRLTVNGTIVDLNSPHFNLENISISYDGKEVGFTEVSSGGYGVWSFKNEQSVTLQFDFGSGLTTYFRGRIKKTTPSGENNNEKIQYSAFGLQNLADEQEYLNQHDYPWDQFGMYSQISSMLVYAFGNNATVLGSMGIGSTFGALGPEQYTTYLKGDLQLRNIGFLSAIKQMVQNEPDKRIFWDDITQTWIFPKLTDTPQYGIDVDLARLDPHSYTVDTTNRYTAVRLWGPATINLVAQSKGTIVLSEGWDSGIQTDWTIRKGAGLDGAADFGYAYSWVFRRWTFDPKEVQVKNRKALNIYALIPYWGEFSWVPLNCVIDLENGIALANVPIVTGGNPNDRGQAKGPLAVVISYVDLLLVPIQGIDTIRFPPGDDTWEGTAYSWFNIKREKKMLIEQQNYTARDAQAQLDILKDVVVSAEIPIVGDIIPEFLNLQALIRIFDTNRSTGIDSILAMLMKYTYQFGRPGKSTLSLSNDKTAVTRVQN